MDLTDLGLAIACAAAIAALIISRRQHATEIATIRALESETRERKQYYRTVFANAGVGIVRIDNTGRIIEANESFQEFIGYPFEKLQGMNASELVHPDDREAMHARAMISASGELAGYRAERRYVRADGAVRWADVRTSAIRHADNSFAAFITVIVDISERKEAELTFRDAQEKLQQITDNLAAAVFQLRRRSDGVLQFTFLNDEIQRLSGRPKARLLTNTSEFFAQIEPEDRALLERALSDSAAKLEKWSCDFRLRHADGGVRWVLGKGVPSRETVGTIVWNGYFSDITERRQLDQKFRAIFDSSFDAYFLVDAQLRAHDCNATAIRVFQAAHRDEILALGPLGVSPDHQPDGRSSFAALRQHLQQALEQGFSKREWLFRARGIELPAELTLIRLEVGHPPTVLLVVHDLTARRQAEAELVESRNLLRGVIDNSLAVICAKDLEGRYLLVNRRWGEILDLAEAAVVGKTDAEIFPADQAEDYRRNDLAVIERREPLIIEEEAMIEGERHTFMAVKFPILDAQGRPRAVCGISTDITDLMKVHEELRVARQQADAANQAKSQFLANMSHEIRTPMNAIVGLAYLALQQPDLPARVRDQLQKIQGAAKGLLGIINEILDFSKIEVGKLTLERIEFDLERVIDNVSGMITLRAQEKGLEIVFAVDPAVPRHLVGDPLRLEQVLVNLAGNAVKFTEAGEVVVEVKLAPRDGGHAAPSNTGPAPAASAAPAGDSGAPTSPTAARPLPPGDPGTDSRVRLAFEVRDTGVGLSADQIRQLFQPFTQADGSTTRKYGGTGLGLSICKRLVEAMRGAIGVTSEPGRGSTFAFTAEFGVAAAHGDALACPDLRHLRVLVVDDHAASREYLSHVLSSLSFEVLTAADGREALAILERPDEGRPIELILMDWQMPGLDGIETTRRIQAMRGADRAPTIIMVTAFGREQAMARAGDVPIDEFLVKPLSPSTLFDSIMRVFKKELPERRPVAVAAAPAIDRRRLEGVRVLLVEDNELNQEVAVAMLARVGMTVRTADNGRLALQALEQEPVDLVVMDCQMPEMDGYECSREIRRRPQLAGLPIIAMTANAVAGDRERCLAAGMNDHVPKPIDPDQLYRVLAQWSPGGRSSLGATGSAGGAAGAATPPARPATGTVTPAADAAADITEIFRLIGLDVEPALARVGGDAAQLRRLLLKFRARNHDADTRITAALAGGNWEEATRLAHTLKGVAATLGANGLAGVAADLERCCRDRSRDQAQRAVQQVAMSLRALIAEIDRRLDVGPLPEGIAAGTVAGNPAAGSAAGVGGPVASRETDVSRCLAGACAPSWRAQARRSCGSRDSNGALSPIVGDGPAEPKPTDRVSVTPATLAAGRDLLRALQADDAESVGLFEQWRSLLGTAMTTDADLAAEMAAVGGAIDQYAFDEAAPLVESILARWPAPPPRSPES